MSALCVLLHDRQPHFEPFLILNNLQISWNEGKLFFSVDFPLSQFLLIFLSLLGLDLLSLDSDVLDMAHLLSNIIRLRHLGITNAWICCLKVFLESASGKVSFWIIFYAFKLVSIQCFFCLWWMMSSCLLFLPRMCPIFNKILLAFLGKISSWMIITFTI